MIVGCVNCSTKFVVPDDKVPESGIKVRCSKCQHTFYIKKEKVKKGGPSSVILVDPELIAELEQNRAAESQQEKAPEGESGVEVSPELGAPAAQAPQPGAQARVATQIMMRDDQTAEETRRTNRPGAPRSSRPVQPPKEEGILDLEEVYLPPDWSKRIALVLVGLFGLAIAAGVAIIIRNDFTVPPAKDALSILISGPKKRGSPAKPVEREKSYEVVRTGIDQLTTDRGFKVVAIQAEVKNVDSAPHGRYYVRATLRGPAGETLSSERPCGTRLDPPRLLGLQSEAELDALYTEEGTGGANKAVGAYSAVSCTVVFFGTPGWAEQPKAVDLSVTRLDGAPVGP